MATQSDRISRLEGIVDALPDRLGSIDNRIGALESRMDTRFTALESRIDTRFNWIFGLIVTTWIMTIIAILVTG